MSMVCERGWGGQAAESVPPTPFGMAFGRLKLSPQSLSRSRVETKIFVSFAKTFAKIFAKTSEFQEANEV
jgi:hypothetical protein